MVSLALSQYPSAEALRCLHLAVVILRSLLPAHGDPDDVILAIPGVGQSVRCSLQRRGALSFRARSDGIKTSGLPTR